MHSASRRRNEGSIPSQSTKINKPEKRNWWSYLFYTQKSQSPILCSGTLLYNTMGRYTLMLLTWRKVNWIHAGSNPVLLTKFYSGINNKGKPFHHKHMPPQHDGSCNSLRTRRLWVRSPPVALQFLSQSGNSASPLSWWGRWSQDWITGCSAVW